MSIAMAEARRRMLPGLAAQEDDLVAHGIPGMQPKRRAQLVREEDARWLRNKRETEHRAQMERASRSQHQLEQRRSQQAQEGHELRTYFDQYDVNASGLLEREELKEMLWDMRPHEPPPSNDVCDAVMRTCCTCSPDGIALEEIEQATVHYLSYVKQKQQVKMLPPIELAYGLPLSASDSPADLPQPAPNANTTTSTARPSGRCSIM